MRLLFIIACLLLFAACSGDRTAPVSQARPLMGTYFTITSYDFDMNEQRINHLLDSSFVIIELIEAEVTNYSPGSPLSLINSAAGAKRRLAVSGHSKALLQRALQISAATNGAFDPTLWPVFRLWHFGSDSAAVPAQPSIDATLPLVNFRQVSLRGDSLFLPRGVEIDLSGISKGYAVEIVRGYLKKRGLKNFIIDASGNLGIEWHRSDSIEVHTRHPRSDSTFWGTFKVVRNCGIATSGDYHFTFMHEGRRYHHIIDPRNGYPASPVNAVTIIAPDAATADGLATAVFVMGPEAGSAFIEQQSNIEGIVLFSEGDRLTDYLSTGLKPLFKRTADELDSP